MKSILLVPNFHQEIDLKILHRLAEAFNRKGFSSEVSLYPIRENNNFRNTSSYSSVYNIKPKDIYKNIKYDIVLEINRARSKYLPKKTVHLGWFQDLSPRDSEKIANINKKSIVYLYGSQKFFGVHNLNSDKFKTLLAGYEKSKEKEISQNNLYDYNLLGYLSPIWELLGSRDKMTAVNKMINGKQSLVGAFCRETIRRPSFFFDWFLEKRVTNIEKFYNTKYFQQILKLFQNSYKALSGSLDMPSNIIIDNYLQKEIFGFIFTEYPRYKDRITIFNILQKLSNKFNGVVAGRHWKNYYPDSSIVSNQILDEGITFFKSACTIHNNTHGLGLHPRVFEAYQSGSFILHHTTPHKGEEGSLEKDLEPDYHFGIYSENTLKDKIEFWSKNHEKRVQGITEARKILSDKHSWDNRASQIIQDIKNL